MTIKQENTVIYKGIAAAPGLVSGPALVLNKENFEIPRLSGKIAEEEKSRLDSAIQTACEQITVLSEKLIVDHLIEEAAVFGAHIMLIKDRSLHKKVSYALELGVNAEAAWVDSVELYACQLENLPDPTLSLRAADLRDVGLRVTKILLGIQEGKIHFPQPSIIIATDLTPSETVSMEKDQVLGFCTALGGPTSHTAILAKALGIPAVVSLGNEILSIRNGEKLLLNGNTGQVFVSPDAETELDFIKKSNQATKQAQLEKSQAKQPAITKDGFPVEIVANIGNAEDAVSAIEYGAEGVGLLRTEFLFLERNSSPTEEEQFIAYDQILNVMGTLPVVVRTLDAGGDKEIPYLGMDQDANPFLGWRAIRLCLAQPEFFKIQLRSLLRASPGHDLRIMFPMIATLQEVREAKQLLNEARHEVISQGFQVAKQIQVGIMVEIPSVVIMADQFAKEVDFFSLGTNDLTQYTMAADRTNSKVAHLNDYCHPAILRLIQQTTIAAHKAGIWVGICGEMAGDLDAIPLLVAIGVDELSMSPSLIPSAKNLIRKLNRQQIEKLLNQIMDLDSAEAVRRKIKSEYL